MTRALFFGGLLGLVALYAHFVVQSLTGPLVGVGGAEGVEETGFLFSKLVGFGSFPHFFFETDWIAFPQGINAVFQGWHLEREYLSALLGQGAWIKWYAAFSPAITAVGSFFLLRGRYGETRAALVGVGAAFLAFYAGHKYPNHMSLALCHWMALNLVADFMLCRIVVDGGVPSLSRALNRVVLLLLALSQDLGDVAGYALASGTLTAVFLSFERKRFPRSWRAVWREEAEARGGRLAGQLCLIVVLGWLYLPLCLQIFSETRRHALAGGSVFWANPLRLLVPWFPFFNPRTIAFGDSAEGVGAASPGWALLFAGIAGAWAAWRARDRAYVPLVLLLFLAVLNHPQNFPLLKLFPWFSEARAASRYTLILPMALCLLALAADWRRGVWILVGLAVLEAHTAFVRLRPPQSAPPGASYFEYHQRIRSTPGEALLDWPFCALDGNGVTGRLCRDRAVQGRHAAQRLHEKKVLGFELGGLTPEMAWSISRVGWHHIHTCPEGNEWLFIDDFVKYNPLAGIQLHLDRLPPGCAEAFSRRYGHRVAETSLPGGGRVAFLPKPESWRELEDRQAGKRLRYEPVVREPVLDLATAEAPYGTTREGASFEGGSLIARRRVSLHFFLDGPRRLQVSQRWESLFPDQIAELWFNGRKVTTLLQDATTGLDAIAGENRLEWEFARSGSLLDLMTLYRSEKGPLAPLFDPTGFVEFQRTHRAQAARFSRLEIRLP